MQGGYTAPGTQLRMKTLFPLESSLATFTSPCQAGLAEKLLLLLRNSDTASVCRGICKISVLQLLVAQVLTLGREKQDASTIRYVVASFAVS